MTEFFLLPFAAGLCGAIVAVAGLLRRRSPAAWCFAAGMVVLSGESFLAGMSLRAIALQDVAYWLAWAFVVQSCAPIPWLCFSLVYSRRNFREFLRRWRPALVIFGLLPPILSLVFRDQLFQVIQAGSPEDVWRLQAGPMARTINVLLLVAFVLILSNLEQTFRVAVGTMRWRIKFVVLALAVIFGADVYVRTQAVLYSTPDVAWWSMKAGALLIGCVLLGIAYARTGLAEIDVSPSFTIVRSSLTAFVVGGYLFVVGVLAQLVARFGGADIFQFQAVVVLVGAVALAVVLLSDRARRRLQLFVGGHFARSQHDSVRIWAMFSQRLARVTDATSLTELSARLICETFDVLSVTIWLINDGQDRLVRSGSTATQPRDGASLATTPGFLVLSSPFDLEWIREPWADDLRRFNQSTFPNGGHRFGIPLRTADVNLGVIVLADRVNGAAYSVEETELLKCIGDQVASVLLNLRLANEVSRAKELDAFRTMSAFFVHDLKNAAASLNLTLRNLPVHFNDPAFRSDALRAIANTAQRVDATIARLSALRQRPELVRVEADLNQLVHDALGHVPPAPEVEVEAELQPVPSISGDRDQLQSVVTNLVLNAREAVGPRGRIHVRTETRGERIVLTVTDNGCGMTPAFVDSQLFRPFQSTKRNGLGIGLFQSRAIVQAHGGGIHVESQVGKGTTFFVTFPVTPQK
jgi:putative PEP-CTERM system histidine kinase